MQGDSYVWTRLATIEIRGSQPGVKGARNLSEKPFFCRAWQAGGHTSIRSTRHIRKVMIQSL